MRSSASNGMDDEPRLLTIPAQCPCMSPCSRQVEPLSAGPAPCVPASTGPGTVPSTHTGEDHVGAGQELPGMEETPAGRF